MTSCLRIAAATAAILLAAVVAGAQALPDPGLSHGMSRAAGMPLRDGALAPGMLTVRIVRGSFDNNVPDQSVAVEQGSSVVTARTAADGRAQFAHLPIGGSVRISALVDGERLESEAFTMPSESGIRVLLIAGGGDATASGVFGDGAGGGAPVTSSAVPDLSVAVPVAPTAAPGSSPPEVAVTVIQVLLSGATLAGLAIVVHRFRRPPKR
jgi:hypothetical protein